MATGKIINSIKVTSSDYGKLLSVDENGKPLFVDASFGVIDHLVYHNDDTTGVPQIINGTLTNGGSEYGGVYTWTAKDTINLVSAKTFDADKTYFVTIVATFDDFAATYTSDYAVTLSHYVNPILNLNNSGTKGGGSGHSYEKLPVEITASFLWKPEAAKLNFDLTINKASGSTSLLTAACTIQEYVS